MGATTKVIIRKYRKNDRNKLIHLLEEFQDYMVAVDSLKRLTRRAGYGNYYLKHLLEVISKNKGIFYLAEVQGEIVGLAVGLVLKPGKEEIFTMQKPSRRGFIEELYVAPPYRGAKIGAKLMKKIESYLIGKGCNSLFLTVLATNTKAYKFYKKFGYSDRDIDMLKEINR